jgi:hypothetical protein
LPLYLSDGGRSRLKLSHFFIWATFHYWPLGNIADLLLLYTQEFKDLYKLSHTIFSKKEACIDIWSRFIFIDSVKGTYCTVHYNKTRWLCKNIFLPKSHFISVKYLHLKKYQKFIVNYFNVLCSIVRNCLKNRSFLTADLKTVGEP